MLLLRSFIALLKISILKSILTRRNQKKRKYNVHGFFFRILCAVGWSAMYDSSFYDHTHLLF